MEEEKEEERGNEGKECASCGESGWTQQTLGYENGHPCTECHKQLFPKCQHDHNTDGYDEVRLVFDDYL